MVKWTGSKSSFIRFFKLQFKKFDFFKWKNSGIFFEQKLNFQEGTSSVGKRQAWNNFDPRTNRQSQGQSLPIPRLPFPDPLYNDQWYLVSLWISNFLLNIVHGIQIAWIFPPSDWKKNYIIFLIDRKRRWRLWHECSSSLVDGLCGQKCVRLHSRWWNSKVRTTTSL